MNTDLKDYEELKSFCIEQGIRDRHEYRGLFRKGKLPAGAPEYPDRDYGDEFEGWLSFLGRKHKDLDTLSYKEAIKYMRKHHKDIKTAAAYSKAYADGVLGDLLPKYPPRKYAGEGWTSWTEFLSSTNRRGSYLPLMEAREKMVKLGLKSHKQFKEYIDEQPLPDGCPRAPQIVYGSEFKDSGGWKWYLGSEFVSYSEAMEIVRAVRPRITKFEEFRKWVESDRRPSNFPSQPHSFTGYKGLFVSYPVFFGTIKDKGSDRKETNKKEALAVIKDIIDSCPELKDDIMALCK